jgi:CBS domain-containing protein
MGAFSLQADAGKRASALETREPRKPNTMLVERILPIAIERLSTIQADASLTDAAKLLCDTHISLVVVCNPDGTMPASSPRPMSFRQIAHGQGRRGTTTAAAVMTRDVAYCRPNESLHDVLSQMKERGFVHVPIIDRDSKPAGVINARDALQILLGEVEHDVSFLRDYVTGIGYR